MTFRDYLAHRPAKADYQGDFVRLARSDRQLPDEASWSELRSHFEERGLPSHVVEAGQKVWADYQVKRKAGERA